MAPESRPKERAEQATKNQHFMRTIKTIDYNIEKAKANYFKTGPLDMSMISSKNSQKVSFIKNRKKLKEETLRNVTILKNQNLNLVKNSYKFKKTLPNIKTVSNSRIVGEGGSEIMNVVSINASRFGKSQFSKKGVRPGTSKGFHLKENQHPNQRQNLRNVKSCYNSKKMSRRDVTTADTEATVQVKTRTLMSGNAPSKSKRNRIQSSIQGLKVAKKGKKRFSSFRRGVRSEFKIEPKQKSHKHFLVDQLLNEFDSEIGNINTETDNIKTTLKSIREVPKKEVINLSEWTCSMKTNFIKKNKQAIKSQTIISKISKYGNDSLSLNKEEEEEDNGPEQKTPENYKIKVHLNESLFPLEINEPENNNKLKSFFQFNSNIKDISNIDLQDRSKESPLKNFTSQLSLSDFKLKSPDYTIEKSKSNFNDQISDVKLCKALKDHDSFLEQSKMKEFKPYLSNFNDFDLTFNKQVS